MKISRQLDSGDCGAACLKMIAHYYGKDLSLSYIKERINLSKYGVSMLNLARGAEAIGFRTVSAQTTLSTLKRVKPFPCIVHINNNHFVVLESIKKSLFGNKTIYKIADPGYGKVNVVEEEFLQSWLRDDKHGIIMTLSPNELDSIDDAASSVNENPMVYFSQYFKRYSKFYIILFLGLSGASLISFILPFLTQAIVDLGIMQNNTQVITMILGAQLLLLLGQLIINFNRNWLLTHVNVRISMNIISDFLSKLMHIPIKYFDTKSHGDIMQRINDHKVVERFLTSEFLSTVFSLINIVVFSTVLALYGLEYFFIFAIGSIASLLWIWRFNGKRKQLNYILFQRNKENQDSILEILKGIEDIKLNNNDLQRVWMWQEKYAKIFRINLKSLKLGQQQDIGSFTFNQIKSIVIIYFAALAVMSGDMSMGMMMSISYITGLLNGPIDQLSGLVQSLQDTKLSFERLQEFNTIESEYKIKDDTVTNNNLEEINITMDNVSFSYEGSSKKLVIRDFSYTFKSGTTTAIVGVSGCGKTTLMKLLLNYYTPDKGQIFVNDVDIKRVPMREWRENIASVLQNGYIFSDTVKNNVIMKEKDDDEWLRHVLTISNCDDFVYDLPWGMNTNIGGVGMNLSAGQKQRILIARAIYKKTNLLLFDEATSALDTKNESEITKNLHQLFKDKTAIVIAHRLSTVKNADSIIVMEKGQIVEHGSHEDLIKKRGKYYELVEQQLVQDA
ncbi:MAG: peptidase domain-containing ABC transporter [bacterium]